MLKNVSGWLGRSLGYLLYGIGVLALLLWLLFPKETVRRSLEEVLGSMWPELRWQVGTVALAMPARLTLRAIEGYRKGEDRSPLVQVSELTLHPHVGESLRTRTMVVGYRMTVDKGSVAGSVRILGRHKGLEVEGTARELRLADVPLISRLLGRALQGAVSGTFTAGLVPPVKGGSVTLEARLKVENGSLGLKRPILSHTEIPFSQGSVILSGHGAILQLEQGVVESELFDGRFSGMISLHGDPVLSQLDVKGAMQPKNKFFKGLDNTVALQAFRMQLKDNALPFRITGDLSNPGIHYEGFAMLVQNLEKELK